jgi:hypothetical protein
VLKLFFLRKKSKSRFEKDFYLEKARGERFNAQFAAV